MIYLLTSFTISFFLLYFVVKLGRRIKNPARNFVPKTESDKIKISPFGGVCMFFGSFFGSLFFIQGESAVLFLPVFLMLLLGFFDDLKKILSKNYHGISARLKFGIQTLVTILVILLSYHFNKDFNTYQIVLPFFGVVDFKLPLVLSFIISYFAFMGTVNATNLTDGLDGLAGKQVLLILSFILTLLYAISFTNLNFDIGDLKIIIFCFLGSIIAFLFYNTNPAKIFMGDGGSMMLGSLIAFIFIMLKMELMLIFIGFIILMEALSVILQVVYFKITDGKRIFKMSPLHHHFQISGIKEQKITEIAFLTTLILCFLFLTPFIN